VNGLFGKSHGPACPRLVFPPGAKKGASLPTIPEILLKLFQDWITYLSFDVGGVSGKWKEPLSAMAFQEEAR